MPANAMDGFQRERVEHLGVARTVWRMGSGPAVVVMSELPGITPAVAGFARRVAASGFTAVMPSLFGDDGRAMSAPYAFRQLGWACVTDRFVGLATNRTHGDIGWLRELARAEHARCGGPGVGAVGMCFTGGFALAMSVDPVVIAPVLSQPSLPFAIGRERRSGVGLGPSDLAALRAGTCAVLGLRFTGDRLVPAERFAALSELLGPRFRGVEIDSSAANPHGIPSAAHSVLTEHLVDEPGHPTREALDTVVRFLQESLLT